MVSLVCREIFREACILSTGKVVCSCIDAEGVRPLGDVNEKSIRHIFLSKEYERLRDEMLSSDHTTFCPSLGSGRRNDNEGAEVIPVASIF
ncbi:MAG: SPASM domain-containing protein [Methanotrichaceae archaeon]|nr:SPASM domain-containing protein [Methanotrichaceae archaeon]